MWSAERQIAKSVWRPRMVSMDICASTYTTHLRVTSSCWCGVGSRKNTEDGSVLHLACTPCVALPPAIWVEWIMLRRAVRRALCARMPPHVSHDVQRTEHFAKPDAHTLMGLMGHATRGHIHTQFMRNGYCLGTLRCFPHVKGYNRESQTGSNVDVHITRSIHSYYSIKLQRGEHKYSPEIRQIAPPITSSSYS